MIALETVAGQRKYEQLKSGRVKTSELYIQKTISLIYGQRKNFIELEKVLLIQANFFLCKQIYFLGSKNIFLN